MNQSSLFYSTAFTLVVGFQRAKSEYPLGSKKRCPSGLEPRIGNLAEPHSGRNVGTGSEEVVSVRRLISLTVHSR